MILMMHIILSYSHQNIERDKNPTSSQWLCIGNVGSCKIYIIFHFI